MRAETQRKRNYNLPYTSVAERQSMNNLDNTRHPFSEVGTFKITAKDCPNTDDQVYMNSEIL
jgi:hypothetical protein